MIKPIAKLQGRFLKQMFGTKTGLGISGATLGASMLDASKTKGQAALGWATDMVVPLKNESIQAAKQVSEGFKQYNKVTSPLIKAASNQFDEEEAKNTLKQLGVMGGAGVGAGAGAYALTNFFNAKSDSKFIKGMSDSVGPAMKSVADSAGKTLGRRRGVTHFTYEMLKSVRDQFGSKGRFGPKELAASLLFLGAMSAVEDAGKQALGNLTQNSWDEAKERAEYLKYKADNLQSYTANKGFKRRDTGFNKAASSKVKLSEDTLRLLDRFGKSSLKATAFFAPIAGGSALLGKNLMYGLEPIKQEKSNRIILELPSDSLNKKANYISSAEKKLRNFIDKNPKSFLGKWDKVSQNLAKTKGSDGDIANLLTKELSGKVADGLGYVTPGVLTAAILGRNIRTGFQPISKHDPLEEGRVRIIIESPAKEVNRTHSIPVDLEKKAGSEEIKKAREEILEYLQGISSSRGYADINPAEIDVTQGQKRGEYQRQMLASEGLEDIAKEASLQVITNLTNKVKGLPVVKEVTKKLDKALYSEPVMKTMELASEYPPLYLDPWMISSPIGYKAYSGFKGLAVGAEQGLNKLKTMSLSKELQLLEKKKSLGANVTGKINSRQKELNKIKGKLELNKEIIMGYKRDIDQLVKSYTDRVNKFKSVN